MSWCGYEATCPVCWKDMDAYEDWKPYPTQSCRCYHCWFVSDNVVDRMTLEEMNDQRADQDLKPITKKQYEKRNKDEYFIHLKKK